MEPTTAAAFVADQLVARHFTEPGVDPLDEIEWTTRDAWPAGSKYHVPGIEVPSFWSQQALDITSKLYLAKGDYTEKSVRTLIERVAGRITDEGIIAGYFGAPGEKNEQSDTFHAELCYLLVHQLAAFNSPVWFNVGRPDRPQQVSACFILGVDDNTPSIVKTSEREIWIFKGGSGSGFNVSKLRGSMEPLSTGGTASGPVSFMRLWDSGAGTFKSGGTTRRAAKLVRLDADHPDIEDFIACKVREEERLRQIAATGENISMDEEGERNVAEMTSFQNANNSVGVTDEFMRKATGKDPERDWALLARTTGDTVDEVDAPDLLDEIAKANWFCADPGLQYDTTINAWHTTPAQGPIMSSNPCFPGETLVDTSEGRIRIDKLAEMYATGQPLPFAFGFDRSEALPAMKRIRQAVMTKMVTELVEVETDKGIVFRCTPDHKILTRDHGRSSSGEYVEAQDLVIGQRLRKVARWSNDQRSDRRYLNHRVTAAVPNGTVCQSRFMWEQVFGPIPEGMEVHHLNEDPTDDRLSNFELVDEGTHQTFHSSGSHNGRFIQVDDAALVEFWETAEAQYGRGCLSPSRWNAQVRKQGMMGTIPLAKYGERSIRGQSWTKFRDWIEGRRGLVNDTVRSVHRIVFSEAIPVYDISVEDTHNFAVATEGVEHTIIVSNCGEYLSNDDTSCNLASTNVLKFADERQGFMVEEYRHVVDVMTTAMDILVGFASFPDDEEFGGDGLLRRRTRAMRQLGLGYSNMGAAIMAQGMPYDSDEARAFAAAVTALTTGRCYRQSTVLSEHMGTFEFYDENRDSMLRVIDKHVDAAAAAASVRFGNIWKPAFEDWYSARSRGAEHGFRNAQASVLAPAGSISYLLDCDTTGVEPAFTLVSYKELAGGGSMKLVNKSVARGLRSLGFTDDQARSFVEMLNERGEEAFREVLNANPYAGEDMHRIDVRVFDSANEISPEGHVRMVASVQPFVSGGISKTINMPEAATWEEIRDIYVLAWELGCKDLAIYRNKSKVRQVLAANLHPKPSDVAEIDEAVSRETEQLARAKRWIENSFGEHRDEVPLQATKEPEGVDEEIAAQIDPRKRLPRTIQSVRHKIHIKSGLGVEHEGYLHAGMYPDGTLGEIFLEGFGKQGGFTSNALGAWATDFSIALQYGVPMGVLCKKHAYMSDETGGVTVPPSELSEGQVPIRTCSSIVDYIARWLAWRFGDDDLRFELGITAKSEAEMLTVDQNRDGITQVEVTEHVTLAMNGHATERIDGPPCDQCGSTMHRAGACWSCSRCGNSTGCG